MNRCAVFDLDGCLIDSAPDIVASVNEMRLSFGLAPLPFERVLSFVGNGARALIERSMQDAALIDADEALARYRQYYDRRLTRETKLYPGVPHWLDMMRAAGYRLAVLTNKPQDSAERILRSLGAADLFSCVIGNGGRFPLKPEPDALLFLLDEFQADPKESWMIGDNWTDLECGMRAGFRTGFLAKGYGNARNLIPDLSADALPDLLHQIRLLDERKGKDGSGGLQVF